MNERSTWYVTATPPTPNGDLHVGHVSGPYLAADIFKRVRERSGDQVVYVSYGDDHQSYVPTTADRLKTEPRRLMDEGNAAIAATLEAYGIGAVYTRPNERYRSHVDNRFKALFDADVFVAKNVTVRTDLSSGQPLYESFAGGLCPECLRATRGGICEDCGHPNDVIDLIEVQSYDGVERFGSSTVAQIALPLERYRGWLEDFYAHPARRRWRPRLLKLVDELLERPLADFPMSHPGTWGIPVDLPGYDGHVWNVWAEMGIGLHHELERAAQAESSSDIQLAQFLGFDNSFFFAIVHPVLQIASHRELGVPGLLPTLIVTNEFLNLGADKFSTSKGHAIWGRELLDDVHPDDARFYLSLKAPEFAQSSFEMGLMKEWIKGRFRPRVQAIVKRLEQAEAEVAQEAEGIPRSLSVISLRLERYSRPDYFSPATIASTLDSLLDYLSELAGSNGQASELLAGLRLWIYHAAAFMPSRLSHPPEASPTALLDAARRLATPEHDARQKTASARA